MSEVSITAEPRTEFGKGAARRTRRANKVPAVVYGHGSDPQHISLPGHALMLALKSGPNVLLRLQFLGGPADGGSELALPKSVSRDPVKGHVEHVDLVLVRSGEKVSVSVPVHLTGEAAPDALVDQQHVTLTVEAEATHIPAHLEASIDGLDVGSHISASQVSLPPGTTLVGDPEQVIVQLLVAPTAADVEADLADAEAELGAGAIGAAAQAEAEAEEAGEVTADEVTGEGDVVPDTESGAGGPAEPANS